MDCTVPSVASHGWQSILLGRNLLRKGLGWIVESGESIRVWQNPWMSCEKPVTPIGPPLSSSVYLRVKDLLCILTNQWDIGKIRDYLPQYENQILRIFTNSTPSPDHFGLAT